MQRVERTFWLLVGVAVLAVGLLSTAVGMPPSPFTGILTAVSGTAAAVSLALAGRILVLTSRARAMARAQRRHGGGSG